MRDSNVQRASKLVCTYGVLLREVIDQCWLYTMCFTADERLDGL